MPFATKWPAMLWRMNVVPHFFVRDAGGDAWTRAANVPFAVKMVLEQPQHTPTADESTIFW